MARHRGGRGDAPSGRPGGPRGHSRRGGATQPQPAPRDGSASSRRAAPSPRGRGRHRKANPSRASSNHRQRVPGWMLVLPDDITVQSLLPFLVWHDTSALGCVNRALGRIVRRGRDRHPQWETHAFRGDSARECLGAMAARLGRGATGGARLRFAPTLAMATLAFADAQDARDAQSAWGELVDAVVARDVLPVGCVLVGTLDGRLVGDSGAPIERTGGGAAAAVTLTLSVAHLAGTAVDTAAFDRKALRWSASGLTEELECPFPRQEDHSDASKARDSQEKTSLLVWSTGAKPAQVLLSLASRWFPDACVGGSVLARADHAPSLMTFCRARDAPRRSKVLAQRKMKATTQAPVGVLSCPSTLLVRLRGKAFIRPLGLCMDRPLTPILKNEALAAMEDVELARQDIRSYAAVSVLDERLGDVDTHHLGAIINHYMQHDHAPGGIVNFYTSSTIDALRSAILPGLRDGHEETCSPRDGLEEPIRSIALFVDRRGMLTIGDHWEPGEYGVVTVRRNIEELVVAIEEQMRAQLLAVHTASIMPLASIVSCSTEIDDGSSSRVLDTIRRSLGGVSAHELVVDGEIGPIIMPGATNNSSFQIQRGTVSGFMVCHSS